MRKLLVVIFALLCMGAAPAPNTFYPEDFGGLIPVVGGDDVPDNDAIQAAINSAGMFGGDVVLSQMYDVKSDAAETSQGNPWRTFAIVITGNSRPVLLRAEGGGGLRAIGDWYGAAGYLLTVYKNANTVTVRDLYIDMSGRTGGDEQQHAIQLDYGAQHVRIQDVTIYHPSLGASQGGDCVRMLGGYTPAELVVDVTIRGLVGLACDRSLIAFQRSVRSVTIDHVTSLFADDNDIDMEATGVDPLNEDTWIQDVTIRGALIVKGGGNGITLGRGIRIRVLDSAVLGGAIFSLSCRDCEISSSTVLQGVGTADSPISIMRSSERTKILNNRVGRLPGSTHTGALLSIAANNGFVPRDTLVMGNAFESKYNLPAVRTDDSDATIIGNSFRFTGSGPVNQNAVAVLYQTLAPGTPASGIVQGNRFFGGWYAAVQIGGHVPAGANSGPVIVTGNLFDGAVRALRCVGLVPNVVRGLNYKTLTSLDECPQATAGY